MFTNTPLHAKGILFVVLREKALEEEVQMKTVNRMFCGLSRGNTTQIVEMNVADAF